MKEHGWKHMVQKRPVIRLLVQIEHAVNRKQYAVLQQTAKQHNRHHQRKRRARNLEDQANQISGQTHCEGMGTQNSAVVNNIMQHAKGQAQYKCSMPVMINRYKQDHDKNKIRNNPHFPGIRKQPGQNCSLNDK
ncbi:hypothetical protein D3C74_395970 [compost metagenome]